MMRSQIDLGGSEGGGGLKSSPGRVLDPGKP
jgi:hypothetical protein